MGYIHPCNTTLRILISSLMGLRNSVMLHIYAPVELIASILPKLPSQPANHGVFIAILSEQMNYQIIETRRVSCEVSKCGQSKP
jgi:hypothetical protein